MRNRPKFVASAERHQAAQRRLNIFGGITADVLIVEDDPLIAFDFAEMIPEFGVLSVRTASLAQLARHGLTMRSVLINRRWPIVAAAVSVDPAG